jgi:hypothetical protein
MHAKTFAARRTLNSTNPRRPPRKERAQTGVATRCETPPVLEPAWTQAGPEARRDSGWQRNGREMTSGHTREFMALMTIAHRDGRAGTSTV